MSRLETKRALRQRAEMEITSAKALAEALRLGRLPKRRWRVEGSRAGTSHLLDEDEAKSARSYYGGTIVEVVAPAVFYREQAKDLPACLFEGCMASAGVPCANGGQPCPPHSNRRKGLRERLAIGLGPCPTCNAKENQPCCTATRRVRNPHKSRLPAAGGSP